MTLNLLRFFHRLLIDRQTLEPRRGFFFFFYYVTGLWVVFIVISMVMLALDLYNFPFFRDFVYQHVGEGLLTTIEKVLF
jgi:hypothetical protein